MICGEQSFQEITELPQQELIRAKLKGIQMHSCYALASATLAEYEKILSALTLDGRRSKLKSVPADLNACSLQWVSRATKAQGCVLLEAFAEVDMVFANIVTSHTFKGRNLWSLVKLTYVGSTFEESR